MSYMLFGAKLSFFSFIWPSIPNLLSCSQSNFSTVPFDSYSRLYKPTELQILHQFAQVPGTSTRRNVTGRKPTASCTRLRFSYLTTYRADTPTPHRLFLFQLPNWGHFLRYVFVCQLPPWVPWEIQPARREVFRLCGRFFLASYGEALLSMGVVILTWLHF